MNWSLVDTKSGHPTVVVEKQKGKQLLHSKYDPIKEAQRWVDGWEIDQNRAKRLLVIGLGAGYHIEQLHQAFPQINIVIWEFNPQYVVWLKKTGLLANIERSSTIQLLVSDDWKEIQKRLLPFLDAPDTQVLVHYPSIELIPSKLKALRALIDDFMLFTKTLRDQGHMLADNFQRNILLGDAGIKRWAGSLNNQPVVLISAGPSLTKQLPILAEIKSSGKAILAAVGTALTPLLKYSIKPDLVMVSDPKPNICEQFDCTLEDDVPLFYLSTANHQAVANFPGPRFIVWQHGYGGAEQQAKLSGEPLIETGGSVATCLLDLVVQLGATAIALVGQDLAYTDGLSHAAGTHDQRAVGVDTHLQVIDYFQQGNIPTSRNLKAYLIWFEKYSRFLRRNVELWNCTEGGAYITGWQHKSLREFIAMHGANSRQFNASLVGEK